MGTMIKLSFVAAVGLAVIAGGSAPVLAGPSWGPPGWQNGPQDNCGNPPCGIPNPPPEKSEPPQKKCKEVCKDVCVPGCDPPDENNTIHGCSSCYSKRQECHEECK